MPVVLRSIKAKIFFLVFLYCTMLFFVSWHKSDPKGPHGGIMKPVGNYFIEIKNPDKFFYAYLMDKKLNSIKDPNLSCQVKFLTGDRTSIKVNLQLSPDSIFVCNNLPGYKFCKVTFINAGNSITAKFENTARLLVQQ